VEGSEEHEIDEGLKEDSESIDEVVVRLPSRRT